MADEVIHTPQCATCPSLSSTTPCVVPRGEVWRIEDGMEEHESSSHFWRDHHYEVPANWVKSSFIDGRKKRLLELSEEAASESYPTPAIAYLGRWKHLHVITSRGGAGQPARQATTLLPKSGVYLPITLVPTQSIFVLSSLPPLALESPNFQGQRRTTGIRPDRDFAHDLGGTPWPDACSHVPVLLLVIVLWFMRMCVCLCLNMEIDSTERVAGVYFPLTNRPGRKFDFSFLFNSSTPFFLVVNSSVTTVQNSVHWAD